MWHRGNGDRVAEAMRWADRRDFLPRRQRPMADDDRPLPIGSGQTNSQPSTVWDLVTLLDVGEGMRVLDVGAGSGWTTAILGRLVGPTGDVVGVELKADLAQWGAENVAAYEMPWATVHEATDDTLGWPAGAPYDRILVSAQARKTPEALVEQLGSDGVLVMPVSGTLLRLRRHGDEPPIVSRHGGYRFVPLR